ncbi:MAG TPA: hypothetical protein VGK32_14795 [Vicinamibacterales bacterium]
MLLTLPVTAVRRETPRNRVVTLALGKTDFPFQAGQYVLLGDHGQPDRRPYSIACAPLACAGRHTLEFLVQVDGNESPGPHVMELAPGRLLDVEGPAGSFVLPVPLAAHRVLFVGGGTGIAPLRAMLWQVVMSDARCRVAMLHSARTPDELSFGSELRQLADEGRIRLIETVTRDAPEGWPGARGRIDSGQLGSLIEGPGTLCFVCGPDSLVEDVPRQLEALGIAPRLIGTEHWADLPNSTDV